MRSGEFSNQSRNIDISQEEIDIKMLLENLSPEDTEALCDSLYHEIEEEWGRCDNSFKGLFNRLNMFNARELNLFDIPVGQDMETSGEAYLRVWKEGRGGDCTYHTRPMVRLNGEIVSKGDITTFSDVYEYRFGPSNDQVATVRVVDSETSAGVQVVKSDGARTPQRNKFENDIIVRTLELVALPSIKQSKQNLATMWSALQKFEQ